MYEVHHENMVKIEKAAKGEGEEEGEEGVNNESSPFILHSPVSMQFQTHL